MFSRVEIFSKAVEFTKLFIPRFIQIYCKIEHLLPRRVVNKIRHKVPMPL